MLFFKRCLALTLSALLASPSASLAAGSKSSNARAKTQASHKTSSSTSKITRKPASAPVATSVKPSLKNVNKPFSYQNLGKSRAMVVEQVSGNGKLLKNRVLTTDKLQEIRTDNNEDGITDLYEVRSGSYTVRATQPHGGAFHKLEIEDRYKKGTLTSTLWLKGSKYVLTRTKYEPHTTFRADEDISVGGMCPMDWGSTSFEDLKWVIDRAVEETGKSRTEALRCRLKQLSEILIDKSCRTDTFAKTNDEMVDSMVSILDSTMNGKNEYLSCLEKNRLGTHSARIQGSLARQIMEAEGALSLALSTADFAEVQKSCEPASVTLKRLGKSMPTRISAQPKFKCEYVSDKNWRANYDDRVTPSPIVMRKTSAYLGSYFTAANPTCTAHQGTASTIFHELLHDSKIKDEDFTGEIELCCSPGVAIDATRKAKCDLVSGKTQSLATQQAIEMLLNSRSSSYHEAVKEVDRQFGTKADDVMSAYHRSLSENLDAKVKELEDEIKKCPDEACKQLKAQLFEQQLLEKTENFFTAKRGGCEAQRRASPRKDSISCRELGEKFTKMIRDMDSKVAAQNRSENQDGKVSVSAADIRNGEAPAQPTKVPSSITRAVNDSSTSIVTVTPDSIAKVPVAGTNGFEIPEISVDPSKLPEVRSVLAAGSIDGGVGVVEPPIADNGSSLDVFKDFQNYGTSDTNQSNSSIKRYYDFRTGQWVQGTSNYRYYSDSITKTEDASNSFDYIQTPPKTTTLPGQRASGGSGGNPKSIVYVPTYEPPPSEPTYPTNQPSSNTGSSRPTGYVGTPTNTSRPTGYAGTSTEISRNDSYSGGSDNSYSESRSENTAPASSGSSTSRTLSSRSETSDLSLADQLRERRNVANDMAKAEQQYMRNPTAMPLPGQEDGRDVQSSTALVSLAKAAAAAVSEPLSNGLKLVKENVDLDLIPQAAASTFKEGNSKNQFGTSVSQGGRVSLGDGSGSEAEGKAQSPRAGQIRNVASSSFGYGGGGGSQGGSSSSSSGMRAASEFEGASGKQADASERREPKGAKPSGGVRPDRGVTTDGREEGSEGKSEKSDSQEAGDESASQDKARVAQLDTRVDLGRSGSAGGRAPATPPTNFVGAVAWISDNYEQARREGRKQESQYVQWQMRVRFVLPDGKYEVIGSPNPKPQRDFKACPIRGTGKAKLVNIKDSCP